MSLHCAGVICLVFGIFAGVTSPAGICGIAVGSAILCCCPQDFACMSCGAKVGIVLGLLQLGGSVGTGAFFVSNVETFCDTAASLYGALCPGSGRRLSLHPDMKMQAHDIDFLSHSLNQRHTRLFASLVTGGSAAIDDLSSMVKEMSQGSFGAEGGGEGRSLFRTMMDTDGGLSDTCSTVNASTGTLIGQGNNGVCEDGLVGSTKSTCTVLARGHDRLQRKSPHCL